MVQLSFQMDPFENRSCFGEDRLTFEAIMGTPQWATSQSTRHVSPEVILNKQRRLYVGENPELSDVRKLFHWKSLAVKEDRQLRYLFFEPTPSESLDKQPLIVWLHGAGDGEADPHHHLTFISRYFFPPPWNRERYPFYFLSVLAPVESTSWIHADSTQVDLMEAVHRAVQTEIADNPRVDLDRVSLVGASRGGTGCWEMAIRFPELFSCVVPIASKGTSISKIESLKSLPVWSFHSTMDPAVPIDNVRITIAEQKRRHYPVRMTEFNSDNHDAWSPAFDKYHLREWLIYQRRDALGRFEDPVSISYPFRVAMVGSLIVLTTLLCNRRFRKLIFRMPIRASHEYFRRWLKLRA